MKVRKSKYQSKNKGRMSLEEIRAGLPLKEEGGFMFDVNALGAYPDDNPLDIFANDDVAKQQDLLPHPGTGLAQMPYSREVSMQSAQDYDVAAQNLMNRYPRGNFDNDAYFHPNRRQFDFTNVPEYLNTAFQGVANMFGPKPTQDTSALNVLSYGQTTEGDTQVFKEGGIHIKPSHRGRFTAYLKRTGKTLEEALHSDDPHVRQMANFARNAKKWKHGDGGPIKPEVLQDGFDSQGNPVSFKKPVGLNNPIAAMKQQAAMMQKDVTNPLNYYNVAYEKQNNALRDKLNANDQTQINPNDTIRLKSGRFRGAAVPKAIVNRAIDSAEKNNIPAGKLLSLIGRESTFGQDASVKGTGSGLNELVSGWNVAEPYKPKGVFQFLHENNVPGLIAEKNSHRYEFSSNDIDGTREYLDRHPELLQRYQQQVTSVPDIGNQSSFDLAAAKLKNQGVRSYNPGDPTYEAMFNKDYTMLANEPELQNYLKSKGAKYKMGGKYRKKC